MERSSRYEIVTGAVLLLLFCPLTFWLYYPGLFGPFLLDDLWNLSRMNARGGILSWSNLADFVFSNASGALGRPISMLSFVISDQHWAGNEYSYKLFNLCLHLTVGLSAFVFVRRISILAGYSTTNSSIIAFMVSALWLVHPLNVSTTLYVVQRMTQLAALFGLWAIIFFLIGRSYLEQQQNQKARLFVALSVGCAGLAVLSKENGILVLPIMIVIEFLFFRRESWSTNYKRCFAVFFVLPTLLLVIYVAYKCIDPAKLYSARDFTLLERVLTQGPVLVQYIQKIIIPNAAGTGLMHDEFPVSRSLFSPMTTLYSHLSILVLLIAAWVLRRANKLFSFGVSFFFIGHVLESTVLPLEMYFEHRNYLPMIGVFMAVIAVVSKIIGFLDRKLRAFIVVLVIFLYLAGASMMTRQNTEIWGDAFSLLTFWATEHPESLRAQSSYGIFLGRTIWYMEGLDVLLDAAEKFPKDASLLMAAANLSCKRDLSGENYRFRDIEERIVGASYHGGYMAIAREFGELFLVGKCSNSSPKKVVHSILDKMLSMNRLNRIGKAEILFLHAELYAKLGNLDMAMKKMDDSYRFSQQAVPRFRQAQYLYSAGLYSEALEYIQMAYEADSKRMRKLLVPSEAELIKTMEELILAKLKESD